MTYNTTYTSVTFPNNAIPTKSKNDKWKKDYMDAVETFGEKHIRQFNRRFENIDNIIDGTFDYENVDEFTINTGEHINESDFLKSQAGFSKEIINYPFLEQIVTKLVGEYSTKPSPYVIDAVDADSKNDYIREKTDRLWERVKKRIQKELEIKAKLQGLDPEKQDFTSQEEKAAYEQQLAQFFNENTPKEIEEEVNKNWKAIYIEWAEATFEEDKLRFSLDKLDSELLEHFIKYGRCFKHYRIGYDFYEPEVWHPKNTFSSIGYKEKYVELGDLVGRIHYYTPNVVIQNYGSKLTADQKKRIINNKNNNGRYSQGISSNLKDWAESAGGGTPFLAPRFFMERERAKWIQDNSGIDLGIRDYFNGSSSFYSNFNVEDNKRTDFIKVTECYFKTFQQVGYLTLEDGTTEIVTDEILDDLIREKEIKQLRNVTLEQHIANPEPNTIVWDFMEKVYSGLKINKGNTSLQEDIIIVDDLEYQLKGESELYHTRLPVVGIIEKNSILSKVERYQIDYNIARTAAYHYMDKELGVVMLFDVAQMSKTLKDGITEPEAIVALTDVVRSSSLMPIDGSSREAQQSRFNQFTAIDMDLTRKCMEKMQLAKMYKQEAFESIGLSLERMGLPSEQTSATGIKNNLTASYAQTENSVFDKFADFQNRSADIHLNIAQFAKWKGKDVTVKYADSDGVIQFFNEVDPLLPLRRFRIYFDNSSKKRAAVESLKQLYMTDNTIPKTLENIAKVLEADSLTKIKQIEAIDRKRADLQQQQLQAAKQEEIKAIKDGELEKIKLEQEWEIQKIKLKGEIDLNKQALLGMGFAENKDLNSNKVPDIIEQLKVITQQLKNDSDIVIKEKQIEQSSLKDDRENAYKQKQLEIEQKKINADIYKADKMKEIAVENKYSYEKKK